MEIIEYEDKYLEDVKDLLVELEEYIVLIDKDNNIKEVINRNESLIAKAPQSFYLKDVYEVHLMAQRDGITDSIDTCTLMNEYGKKLSVVLTDYDNIKITTIKDLALAESIYKRRNNIVWQILFQTEEYFWKELL